MITVNRERASEDTWRTVPGDLLVTGGAQGLHNDVFFCVARSSSDKNTMLRHDGGMQERSDIWCKRVQMDNES